MAMFAPSRMMLAMRQSAAPLCARAMSSHWANLESMVPDSKKAEFSGKVAELRKRQEAATVSGAVDPIDWDGYKATLDAAAVDAVKAEYDGFQYTDFEANKDSELAELEATKSATVGELAAKQAEMEQFSADAAAQLSELRRNKTTMESGLDEVLSRYPEISAQIEKDISEHYWDSDNVLPVDVQAKRVALIKERWDARAFGALDEATMKEFLDEVEASSGATVESDRGTLDAAHHKALNEWCELVKHPIPNDTTIDEWAAKSEGALSASDEALTNEADLWGKIMSCEAKGESARAMNLLERMKKLQADGLLEENEAWRREEVKAMAAQAPPPLGAFDPEELDGKSHDDMVAMAKDAEDKQDWYRATQIMLAAHRSSGVIDNSTDINTFPGLMNFIDKLSKKAFTHPHSA